MINYMPISFISRPCASESNDVSEGNQQWRTLYSWNMNTVSSELSSDLHPRRRNSTLAEGFTDLSECGEGSDISTWHPTTINEFPGPEHLSVSPSPC